MGNDGAFIHTYQHTCMCVYMLVPHQLPILLTHLIETASKISKTRNHSVGEKVVLISSERVHSKAYRKQEESHRYRVNTFFFDETSSDE